MLERCTLRVLMLAITNGVVQTFRSSSKIGLFPGGCFGPSDPVVSAKGLRISGTRLGSLAAAENSAFMLAAVPPENVPFIVRTRPFTRETGAPNTFLAVSWQQNTPSSNGSES